MHEYHQRVIDLKEDGYRSQTYQNAVKGIEKEFDNSNVDYYNIERISSNSKHFKTKEEARNYLNECWKNDCEYSYLATYDFRRSQKYVSLRKRLETEEKKLVDYRKAHSCNNFKSALIGCDQCGSKIAKEYIKNDECPVCGHDLRSQTTKDTIKRYENNIKDLKKQISNEERTMANKKSYEKYLTKGTLVMFAIDTHI